MQWGRILLNKSSLKHNICAGLKLPERILDKSEIDDDKIFYNLHFFFFDLGKSPSPLDTGFQVNTVTVT